MSDEVDFLHFSKHQSFLQVDLIFCDRFFQECPKFPDKFFVSQGLLQVINFILTLIMS